jgi:hypothetical protein
MPAITSNKGTCEPVARNSVTANPISRIADHLLRRGLNARSMCPLCEQESETANHIAVGCVLAREVWYSTLRRCDLQHLTPIADDELIRWWPEARQRVPRPHRKGFDSIVLLLMVWTLWKEQNSRVFQRYAHHRETSDTWDWVMEALFVSFSSFGASSRSQLQPGYREGWHIF